MRTITLDDDLPTPPVSPALTFPYAGYVRLTRRRADLSQRDLAELLGVGQSTVADWETGRTRIDAHTLSAVLELAGLRLCVVVDHTKTATTHWEWVDDCLLESLNVMDLPIYAREFAEEAARQAGREQPEDAEDPRETPTRSVETPTTLAAGRTDDTHGMHPEEVGPLRADPVRDAGRRRFPAHLDVLARFDCYPTRFDRPTADLYAPLRSHRDRVRAIRAGRVPKDHPGLPDVRAAHEAERHARKRRRLRGVYGARAAAAGMDVVTFAEQARASAPMITCTCPLECEEWRGCAPECPCGCEEFTDVRWDDVRGPGGP